MIQISKDLDLAKNLLENDEVVAIPTETVYGLAGNIFSEKAIKKIFETKQRPFFNPLIVHVHSLSCLEAVCSEFPLKAKLLANNFWPGPLTLVLKKRNSISDLVTGGKDTVAVRIPNHPLTLDLLSKLNFPVAAPSANPFGSISPTTAKHVINYFSNTLPLVLDGGNCENGIESTIIGFENEEPILYRLGAISREEIESVVGPILIKNKNENAPEAPGMLTRHYAPLTKTILVNDVKKEIKKYPTKRMGLLLFNNVTIDKEDVVVEILSKKGSFKEATANLYAAMHRLDTQNLDLIIAQKFPEIDLGNTINDRLERATKNN